MAKVKKDTTPHYELLFIVPNKFTEEELKPILAKVRGIIEKNGGSVTYSEEWGNKKMAYRIQGFTHGYYNLFEFDLAGSSAEKINRELRMSSEVLRHMMVAKKARTEEEIKAEKMKEEKRRTEEVIKEQAEEEEKIEKEKEKAKPKMDLKDLDEKLDKILDTDDLL
jgi:small subunit ribosomal protein S6